MVYTLLIHDDRYTAPSLYLLTETDDAVALEAARTRLAESGHHRGFELWDGDRLVLRLGGGDEAEVPAPGMGPG